MAIYLDGLERSGNVYLSYAISSSVNAELKSLRTHDLKTLKEYDKPDPFIVPVRDAIDSISSSLVFRNYVFNNKVFGDVTGTEAKIEKIIERYQEYTKYLIDNPQFFIAPFNYFIKDHNPVIEKMKKFYPNQKDLKDIKHTSKSDVFLKIKLKENDFSFCPEITTKIGLLKIKIKEVPIKYNGRDYDEGKKISLST